MDTLLHIPRIVFDFGAIRLLGRELAPLEARRPLVVTDAGLLSCGVAERVLQTLPAETGRLIFAAVPENPTLDGVAQTVAHATALGCDSLIALGGGSVIDTAKAAAMSLSRNQDFATIIGRPERLTARLPPLIAVPTTAGSGSETSPGCGIHPDATSRAVGTRSHRVVPLVALCDPELTLTLPPRLTAGTGMDALSHCIEGFLAKPEAPQIDAMALAGMRRAVAHVARAVRDATDREARWHMLMASLEGGIAIAKGLGPAHAMANAFGDQGLHHGLLCALSLPGSLDLMARHVPQRMAQVAAALGCTDARAVAPLIRRLNAEIGLPADLRSAGLRGEAIGEMSEDAVASPFNRASPYAPSLADYAGLMADAIG